MARAKIRTIILCEDRTQEHFVRKLCEELGARPVAVMVAPRGHGSAEQWVRKQYPGQVRRLRGYGDELVGLVVMTDGDRFGVEARKLDFAAALAAANQMPRNDGERIPICVPTWSIETWFAWLGGLEGVDETRTYKKEPGIQAAQRRGEVSPSKAAEAWLHPPREDEARQLPSLADGRGEIQRLAR